VIGTAPNGFRASITGIGSYVPERVLTNAELSKMVDTSDEWIIDRTGIRERRIAAPDQALSDLCRPAITAALAQAGAEPSSVDLLVVATVTPDMAFPSTGAILADDLGMPDAGAYDLSAGCTGFMYALAQAYGMMAAGLAHRAVVAGGDVLSKIMDWTDRSTCVLFGDGAAGVVVTGREAPGPRILASECFLFPNSLAAMGFDLRDSGFHIVLSKDVPELIRERVKDLAEGFLARQGLRQDDISAFLLHPGGQKLLSYMQEELGLDRSDTEISWDILRRYGNLSSASVLFILNEWLVQKEMPSGSYGLLMAFGPGFTAEMLLLQWP